MTYLPGFVSEFPDKIVADCVPASGLMLVNKITHNRYPASITEREALQNAMGTQDDGATTGQLAAGIAKRYGLTLLPNSGWSLVAAQLTCDRCGVVILGKYPLLPAYIRNQGNQPGFDGIHALYAQADGTGTVTVGDPLASRWIYGIPAADLRAYAEGWGNAAHVAGKEQPVRIGYRLVVPNAGKWTFYSVVRFTHLLVAPRDVTFSRRSWAPVAHGSPGFWMITAGELKGKYAVYGHTQPLDIYAVYSDGSLRPVGMNT